MIRIERPSRLADRVRKYRVMLDGHEAGRIGNGETLELDAGPGPHELRFAIDWCSSPSLAFEVPAAEDGTNTGPIAFECTPAMAGLGMLVPWLYITLLRKRYIRLERVG